MDNQLFQSDTVMDSSEKFIKKEFNASIKAYVNKRI